MKTEMGKYFLDISKLIFAGIVVGNIFSGADFSRGLILAAGLSATILFALIGFMLTKEGELS
jgi:hypothetical protein